MINVFGEGVGSPYIDLTVGAKWGVTPWLDETEEQGAIQKEVASFIPTQLPLPYLSISASKIFQIYYP
jgi:hypothetical protein